MLSSIKGGGLGPARGVRAHEGLHRRAGGHGTVHLFTDETRFFTVGTTVCSDRELRDGQTGPTSIKERIKVVNQSMEEPLVDIYTRSQLAVCLVTRVGAS